MFSDRNYAIIPVSELSKVDFSQILETSADTVRRSVDQTKTFFKWEGATPDFYSTLVGVEGPYTHEEMLAILATTEWTPPMPAEV